MGYNLFNNAFVNNKYLLGADDLMDIGWDQKTPKVRDVSPQTGRLSVPQQIGPIVKSAENAAGVVTSTRPGQAPLQQPRPKTTPVQPAANTAGAVANKPTPINPMSATDGIDNILQGLYTSKEEEERRRKASVANQRMLAVFDALRHVGNIYHTVQGATPQKYNDPVAEERARYEKGKALRDAANLKYLTYQQAKAAQDAAQKKWEQQFNYNIAKDAANLQALRDYRAATIAEQQRYHDLQNALNTRKADDAKEKSEKDFAIKQQNANANTLRASRYGTGGSKSSGRGSRGSSTGGYTETTEITRDSLGRETSRKKTKTPTGTYDQQKKPLPGQSNTGKKKLP